MPEAIVAVSFFGAPPSNPDRLDEGQETRSRTTWQNLNDPLEYLVLLRFPSPEAAHEDLRQRIEAAPESGPVDLNLPTEVHHVVVKHRHGAVLDEVPEDGFLAVVRIVADPGYGREAGERLDETLTTFAMLEPYCGHLQGVNEGIAEEAWAFVFATSRTEVPMPESSDTVVRAYGRIS